MNACVSEPMLVALASGDGTAAARMHVRGCARCAARAAALAEDLRILRQALAEEPLPARARPARRRWIPWSLTAAAAALLAVVWAAPWRDAPGRPLSRVPPVSDLARDASAALFASSRTLEVAQLTDGAYLQAALNGGWPCGGLGLYGIDCRSETLALDDE